MQKKVLVAMSGGVDSSVAASLVKDLGYECKGITLKLLNSNKDTEEQNTCDARLAAHKLGLVHHYLDLKKDFDNKVIRHFIETYEAGGTPNPCVNCNRNIKFNIDLYTQSGFDFDFFVTGHYARTEKDESGRWLLKKAKDKKKDQSYVLYCLTQKQLSRIIFPLGNLSKDETRAIAREKGLLNADREDSQDICFVPEGDYGSFIEKYKGKKYPKGDILDLKGNIIGQHKGIIRYTLGQRRGLGVAVNYPVYVTAINPEANTVTLGDESALLSQTLFARNINLIAFDTLEKPLRCMVKTRYLQEEKPALAEQTGPDELKIIFDEAQRAITPGQAAVLYDGELVIGGGTIV